MSKYFQVQPPEFIKEIIEERDKYLEELNKYRETRLQTWWDENWEMVFGHYETEPFEKCDCPFCECEPGEIWIKESIAHVQDFKLEDFEISENKYLPGRPFYNLTIPPDTFKGHQISDNTAQKTLTIIKKEIK